MRTLNMIQNKDKFVSKPLAGLLEMIQKWTELAQHVN
jgi:hypothetical protein